MTEHAAVIFVFFFLAEYASIVLICILTCILFLGGYLYNYISLFWLTQYLDIDYYLDNLVLLFSNSISIISRLGNNTIGDCTNNN